MTSALSRHPTLDGGSTSSRASSAASCRARSTCASSAPRDLHRIRFRARSFFCHRCRSHRAGKSIARAYCRWQRSLWTTRAAEASVLYSPLQMNVWKPFELFASAAAKVAWSGFQGANRHFTSQSFQPAWAPAPLLKSHERTRPQLGWPRTTDSLCPICVRETRARILSGEQSLESLVGGRTAEIDANIVERDGKVLIEKTCPVHGTFTDTMAINPAFLQRMESLFPGRDFPAVTDTLHNHGTSSIRHGRGAVLTIDLTNRCNMMCDPCFMDANQVGYVHELTLDEVKKLLDDAVSVKPRRQMTVQFSGGEPTISPIFLDAVRYAGEVGYFSVQAATNGIR